jgi:protein-tyrosine phosphatase
MIDIHAHLIPNVDDGPNSLQDALMLCRAVVADGISHSICTPHILPGRFNNTKQALSNAFELFQQQIALAGIDLKLGLAAEVHMDIRVLELIEEEQIPYLGKQADTGINYMLLELPDAQIPVGAEAFVKRLMDKHICPVIVHPERNRSVFNNPAKIRPFVEAGCQLQITAASLLGQFGPLIEKSAWQLIESGSVQAVASDCHNTGGRSPRMTEAKALLIQRYGIDTATALTHTGPAKLCAQ